MIVLWYRVSVMSLLAAGAVIPACVFAATLKIGGTGTDLGTMRLLADAYQKRMPGTKLEIQPSVGSSGGISAVIAGALDISISSRPLKDDERAKGAREYAYAKTPFVMAVNLRTQVKQLTSTEIISIYDGTMTRWKDGSAIRLILRPESETDTKLLVNFIPGIEAAMARAYQRRGPPISSTDQEAADQIEKIPGAVGPSSLALILGEGRPLKALSLNGVAPTVENIGNGSYPMTKTLYLITGPQVADDALRFVEFLRSKAGVAILKRTGHLVLVSGVK